MARKTAIIGVGQTKYGFKSEEMTWPELARLASARALEHAGLTIDEIDAVVLGLAPTALIGVHAGEQWAAGAVGAVGKPFMRINTGGATGGSAAQAGYYHIASGMARTVLVVSAEKVAESEDAQQVIGSAFDPFYERPFGLNAINMCAFQGLRHMQKYGTTQRQLATIAVRSRANGMRNPLAHLHKPLTIEQALATRNICYPLKLSDCCPRSSGACAIVIAVEDVVKRVCTRPAWIRGYGARTNTFHMGDKMGPALDTDHGDFDDLALAAREAYRMAGITRPEREVSVAEIYAPFTCSEVAAVEALGLCPKGQGGPKAEVGAWDMDGEIPVNPSGGTLCSNPISATAQVRVCEAALQVMQDAGDRQVPGAQIAIATGIGGSLQFHTAMVLGADM
ncbi:MAG: thiolase family protein [Planctomycetaceae bacterium]